MVSLRAGLPLSHMWKWQRAKQSGGVESGEEAMRKCLSCLAALLPASTT